MPRGPCCAEPAEAHAETVPVGKRTAPEVQEKVAPWRAGIRPTSPFPLRGFEGPAPKEEDECATTREWIGRIRRTPSGSWTRAGRRSPRAVSRTAQGLGEWGRELDEWRAQGIDLWAAIERPDGRVVDFLLDHGVVVYPVNPKALDRARDRFRQSGAQSDPFDARVLADFLRTDHAHLRALQPSSEAAQELKLVTEDCQRHIRQQTRLVNQLTATLKAYYPRALEVAAVTSALAREFLPAYPTPEALTALTERQYQRGARPTRVPEARTGQRSAVPP